MDLIEYVEGEIDFLERSAYDNYDWWEFNIETWCCELAWLGYWYDMRGLLK